MNSIEVVQKTIFLDYEALTVLFPLSQSMPPIIFDDVPPTRGFSAVYLKYRYDGKSFQSGGTKFRYVYDGYIIS